MKQNYENPTVEFDRFDLEDILTSSGIGEGDGLIDTLDEEIRPIA